MFQVFRLVSTSKLLYRPVSLLMSLHNVQELYKSDIGFFFEVS